MSSNLELALPATSGSTEAVQDLEPYKGWSEATAFGSSPESASSNSEDNVFPFQTTLLVDAGDT